MGYGQSPLRDEIERPKTSAGVCLLPDADANLPDGASVGADNAAAIALGGDGEEIRLAIGRLDREVLVTVPTASIKP